jgi:large subunit ribosomal protein L43
MARRGVWELEKITLYYCLKGGSSQGTRGFVVERLAAFARENPQIQFETVIEEGHPEAVGLYRNGYKRTLSLRNLEPIEVHDHLLYLRNTWGEPEQKHSKISYGVISNTPSVQGYWRTEPDLEAPSSVRRSYLGRIPPGVPPQYHSYEQVQRELGLAGAAELLQNLGCSRWVVSGMTGVKVKSRRKKN